VADRRYACDHVKKLKQYRNSNIIIETKGRKTSFTTSAREFMLTARMIRCPVKNN
jgi:hypothetical protein